MGAVNAVLFRCPSGWSVVVVVVCCLFPLAFYFLPVLPTLHPVSRLQDGCIWDFSATMVLDYKLESSVLARNSFLSPFFHSPFLVVTGNAAGRHAAQSPAIKELWRQAAHWLSVGCQLFSFWAGIFAACDVAASTVGLLHILSVPPCSPIVHVKAAEEEPSIVNTDYLKSGRQFVLSREPLLPRMEPLSYNSCVAFDSRPPVYLWAPDVNFNLWFLCYLCSPCPLFLSFLPILPENWTDSTAKPWRPWNVPQPAARAPQLNKLSLSESP